MEPTTIPWPEWTMPLMLLFLPLLSAMLAWCIRTRYAWLAAFVSPLLMLITAGIGIWTLIERWPMEPLSASIPWWSAGDLRVGLGLYLDSAAIIMVAVVSIISFLVHIYSAGYMAGDPGLCRYYSMLGFFTFAMLGLVMTDSLLVLFVFWELVGFASYKLVGHWQERPHAASAATKAFLVNRFGDLGFLIGLCIVYTHTKTFDLSEMLLLADGSGYGWQTAAALCIAAGVAGKSAQFPLFNWLPDAMQGPTPVSALIHAATMVAAGIYLLVRIHTLFTPIALDVIAVVGMVTALAGAIAALHQYDMKRILAYSTISQLGMMVMAVGMQAYGAAFLHLVTHAFFKAGLFLCVGSVIHVMHQADHAASDKDVQDIRNLGGLRRFMPVTFLCAMMCGSALAGLPFFSGFLSKDILLTQAVFWAEANPWRWLVTIPMFFVSFLTAMYTFRLIWSVFIRQGERKWIVTDSPAVMRFAMILTAVASLWFLVSFNPIIPSGWFSKIQPALEGHSWGVTIFSVTWILFALVVAYRVYRLSPGGVNVFIQNGYGLEKLYFMLAVNPVQHAGRVLTLVDKRVIDRGLHAIAYTNVVVAHVTGWLDRSLVDGLVHAVVRIIRGMGALFRGVQSGKIQLYIFWAIFTVIIFIISTLIF